MRYGVFCEFKNYPCNVTTSRNILSAAAGYWSTGAISFFSSYCNQFENKTKRETSGADVIFWQPICRYHIYQDVMPRQHFPPFSTVHRWISQCFLCLLPARAITQPVELSVIVSDKLLTWLHCNEMHCRDLILTKWCQCLGYATEDAISTRKSGTCDTKLFGWAFTMWICIDSWTDR